MAKKTAAELLADAGALYKRAKEMERQELKDRIDGLGKLTETYVKGELSFEDFVSQSETISGWKFQGLLPAKKTNAVTPSTEISA
jgi:hypothetical protein